MNHSRRQLPPMTPRKRKEIDETFHFLKPSKLAKTNLKPILKPVPPRAMASIKPSKSAHTPPAHNNLLLAGYLAHEYLTKGTLFGELYDPARALVPTANLAGLRTMKEEKLSENKSIVEPKPVKNRRYIEVSELLKNGAHIPGIVNPSQLARFLNLQENK